MATLIGTSSADPRSGTNVRAVLHLRVIAPEDVRGQVWCSAG